MFFGVELKPDKVLTQQLKYHLKLRLVALGPSKSEKPNVLNVEIEGRKFVLCTLRAGGCEQQSLNLTFLQGSKISFYNSQGDGSLFLSGNYFLDYEESDNAVPGMEASSSDETYEGSSDPNDDLFQPDSSDEDIPIGASSSSDNDDDMNVGSSDQHSRKSKKRKAASPSDVSKATIAPDAAATSAKKKQKKAPQQPSTPHVKGGLEKTLPGGVKYKVTKIPAPNSKRAKHGNRVTVAYVGRFQKNNKQFDSSKNFRFRLGGGEVIPGWEVGVKGMAVGEKRTLIVPPKLGYGTQGIREGKRVIIPPNSTLVFDIELKKC
mmetsp:Transcript_807/g.1099  ORF Transcript_807/g.1099 Transcript_807/m.1099 type:complete len:319 (+) Transcript_807:461-1417(+)|eukprot:CAMPEP_0201551526 /NCGR_PEP_ID=MMETSP0173_2-20130828/7688_1 /ASSEMBLY_ACC=CAM_ASM_000268 /TAXON_ID=218659 /ORGANISM="Vexillifera sp., Strain DIVA3 564/2" /LENGTH=318 /DNA_ID=CAMNT_0047961807 /DNA_START=459 /DNA_END=1415 /DNA_ORIENTATION=+